MATVGRTEKNDEDASPTCAQSGTPTPRPRAKCAPHTPTARKAYADKTLRVSTSDLELGIRASYRWEAGATDTYSGCTRTTDRPTLIHWPTLADTDKDRQSVGTSEVFHDTSDQEDRSIGIHR